MDNTEKMIIGVCALIVLCLMVFCVIAERKTIDAYNRVTGSKISYSDGFWLDLKIVSPSTTNQPAHQ